MAMTSIPCSNHHSPNSNWTIAKVFFQKVTRFVSIYLSWKNSHQKGTKVAKYCAKVTLVCVRHGSWWQGAVGICGSQCGYCSGLAQINQCMRNTDLCWKHQVLYQVQHLLYQNSGEKPPHKNLAYVCVAVGQQPTSLCWDSVEENSKQYLNIVMQNYPRLLRGKDI